jgi:hypothetical protein
LFFADGLKAAETDETTVARARPRDVVNSMSSGLRGKLKYKNECVSKKGV